MDLTTPINGVQGVRSSGGYSLVGAFKANQGHFQFLRKPGRKLIRRNQTKGLTPQNTLLHLHLSHRGFPIALLPLGRFLIRLRHGLPRPHRVWIFGQIDQLVYNNRSRYHG